MRRWLPLILIVLAPACGDDGPVRPPEATDPPVILGVLLEPDSVLVDTVRVAVAAERADIVSLWVDGILTAADMTPPFLLVWDSHTTANGTHELTVRADNAGGGADTTLSRPVSNPVPLAEIDLLRDMYHSGYETVVLAEQVTGMAGTALGMARYLGGDETIRSGRLYENAEGWHYEETAGYGLEILPQDGPRTVITYAVADGFSPTQERVQSYCRGVDFMGELDCVIRVGESGSALRLTNSSRPRDDPGGTNHPDDFGAAFERTLSGTIPGADGGLWEFNLSLNGEIWRKFSLFAPGFVTGVAQALSGTFTPPAGFSVAVEESFTAFSDVLGFHHTEYSQAQSFAGSFVAHLSPQVYRWDDISFYWFWAASGPLNFPDWHASGTVRKNGVRLGTVGFDRPLSPGMGARARPLVSFGDYRGLYLDVYRFEIDVPGPAATPFRIASW